MVLILMCSCSLPPREDISESIYEELAAVCNGSTENTEVLKTVIALLLRLTVKENILRLFTHLCLCLTLMNTYIFWWQSNT